MDLGELWISTFCLFVFEEHFFTFEAGGFGIFVPSNQERKVKQQLHNRKESFLQVLNQAFGQVFTLLRGGNQQVEHNCDKDSELVGRKRLLYHEKTV